MAECHADITIRPANADDANAAVPLIYSSGPEVWDFLFGDGRPESSLPYLQKAWVSGLGVAGYRAHWVAEQDGAVLGAVSVYNAKVHKALGNQTALQAIRYFGWRVLPRLRHMLRLGKIFMRAPGAHVDYVANFGVAPAARGQGIGGIMLAYFLRRAGERGQQFYELDVATSNPRGQALYERFGMAVVSTNHDPYFAERGLSDSRRMRMPVS